MKLAVFGQRDITDVDEVSSRFHELDSEETLLLDNTVYIHGGAKGPQKIIFEMLSDLDHVTVLFQPWSMVTDRLGKFTVDMFDWRNKQILDNADEVVIYDNGAPDREVEYVLNYVRRHGIPNYIIKM